MLELQSEHHDNQIRENAHHQLNRAPNNNEVEEKKEKLQVVSMHSETDAKIMLFLFN